jgi:hypothetical protein
MKIAVMQPYFLPYLGYWQLITAANKFVFFDVVQYNRKSWMNRNRIIHPDNTTGYQFVSVPISKHVKGTQVSNVKINNSVKWKEEFFGKLTIYKHLGAKNYSVLLALFSDILSKKHDSLLELTIQITGAICHLLSVEFDYEIASELSFDKATVEEPGDWALNITKSLNGTEYINPYGGFHLFDEGKYKSHGIKLSFLKPKLKAYSQIPKRSFVEGLSILDILMFNDLSEVLSFINNDFEIFTKEQLNVIHE